VLDSLNEYFTKGHYGFEPGTFLIKKQKVQKCDVGMQFAINKFNQE
jgi:hypothetical protein